MFDKSTWFRKYGEFMQDLEKMAAIRNTLFH